MRFFNQFQLQTPESVELEFTLAGIGNRALALLIDYVVLLISLFLFWVIYGFFSFQIIDILEQYVAGDAVEMWLIAIASLISFFLYVGYFVIFETLGMGQTPGKYFTKIRVIQDNGRRAGLGQAIIRSLLRPVDDTLFIGVFMITFGKREKRIGDWVAGTIVIQAEQAIAPTTFSISPPAEQLAQELHQVKQITELLPDEFATLREYLQRRHSLNPKARQRLSQQLTERIQSIIHLEQIPNQASSDTFLEAVYLAYQQIDHQD